jgi:DNA polymerase I-like protein with 3'-5' exonuclease and polymerase domains
MEKYRGIAKWHKTLATEALSERKITTPSGRQFSFPDISRRRDGTVTGFTMIKNYPVQSFATADIVPVALLMMEDSMNKRGLKSCIVNTVHDSMVIDIYPDEQEKMVQVIEDVESNLVSNINELWNIDFNIPLTLEAGIGPNWLEQKDIA